MKSSKSTGDALCRILLCSMALWAFSLKVNAQEISIWHFRHVEPANMEEFVERETKYWSKVAQAAIDRGDLSFWGLWVKQGGFDLPNSPNVIFINSFENIDAVDMAEVWNATAVFPDTPMEEMETYSISKTLHLFYVRPENWIQKEGSVPAEEFNYTRFIFHNSDAPADLIALENEHWAPFIKSAIENGQTSQVAWGNATILAPSSPNMEANTISYDIFPTLSSALNGGFSEDTEVEFPQDGLNKINEMEINRRFNNVYRRIMVINPDLDD